MTAEHSRVERIKDLLRTLNEDGIRDRDVLLAIAKVPRERFVPERMAAYAWENRALPIGEGQTISQPYVVALMTQALRLDKTCRVLEIGTGSGYQTALLAELAGTIISIERHVSLARQAARRLAALGYTNARIIVADGSDGWPFGAPYDRIIVTAAAPAVNPLLLDQLALSSAARLVIPVGDGEQQDLLLIKRADGTFRRERLGTVRFVPLIGSGGYDASSE